MNNVDKKFVSERRFYPELDELIDKSDNTFRRRYIKRAQIKAYIMMASNGNPFFACACGEFAQSMTYAHMQTKIPASACAQALSISNDKGEMRYLKFQLEHNLIPASKSIAERFRLSQMVEFLLSCRMGLGMLRMDQLVHGWQSVSELEDMLERYKVDPLVQMQSAIIRLDEEMLAKTGNYAAVANYVRVGIDQSKLNAFGKACWQASNKLYAAGHNTAL
jgi:predicted O-linked N-acetylglucosamine transferase (SPINDLY family)